MQAANPYATGAGGPDFERRVATGFVCASLVGVPIPPLTVASEAISLQAAHLNCGFDDILLETAAGGKLPQRLFVSVKSTITPSTSNLEFVEVISKAWKDWQAGISFDRNKDAFLLVAATSRSPRIHQLGKLTDIARASVDRADFEHRLSLEGYNRSDVRELRPEIAGIVERETHVAADNEELWQFLRRFFVSTFDFDQDASQDKSRVIGMLRLASEARDGTAAESCWNAVFESISLNTAKAKTFKVKEIASIASLHGIQTNTPTRIRTWLSNLRTHCRLTRGGITSTLFANHSHVLRQKQLDELREALSVHQFTLIIGPPGSGKSALAAEAAEIYAKPENVFCFRSEELAHPHLDAALQAAGLRDLNVEEWSDALPFEPRVLLIEALERLHQSTGGQEALAQLLRTVNSDRRWRVVATCRDYLADHVRHSWDVPNGWALIHVPLLTMEEFEQAITGSTIPALWLEQPAIRDALRNLKWLDLTMRAAQQISDTIPSSTWATLADWRGFVWRRLLNPEVDRAGQELLIWIGIQRATSGSSWVTLQSTSLAIAEQLRIQGILRRHDLFVDRYCPEHDLLEDWALLFYIGREFADHAHQPVELFARLGGRLMVRRAFRQFLGELLESERRKEIISFIRQVFAENSSGKQWREEVAIALLGSSCAIDALHQTRDLWTNGSGEGLRTLCHVLRIGYMGKPYKDGEPERPFGPGWNAVMGFIHAQGDHFLREQARTVTALLLDWHYSVTPECPTPQGLTPAAALVRGLWRIATEGQERFERYWTDNKWYQPTSSTNRLCWLVASVAGALEPRFFHGLSRVVFGTLEHNTPATRNEKYRQCRQLVDFLVSDQAGWTLARAHPRAMVRLCLKAYGLAKRGNTRSSGRRFGGDRICGLTADRHDFSPPSALRGPFFELLRHHRNLGEAFLLRLVNGATDGWAHESETHESWEQSFDVTLKIDDEELTQTADEGWWKCYRGWSPYPYVLKCALMALEKWLLEDVAARDLDNLQTVLLRLVSRSKNVAVTAVAAAVGGVQWWHCGKLAAVLLECWPLLELDRHRLINERQLGGLEGGWAERHSSYLKERRESNALPHRQEHLEYFILKAQLGPGRSEIWPVIDKFNDELSNVQAEEATNDELQTARLILHRIDSRNLTVKQHESISGQILLQPTPPPMRLQKHLEASEKLMQTNWLPMEMEMWASQILEPMGSTPPQPERWREMLEKARKFPTFNLEPERILAFGSSPTMVAAVCLRDFISELNQDELAWCILQVTEMLFQHSELTLWQPGSMLTSWRAECAAARICGILSATRLGKSEQMGLIDKATAIALSHPEKRVRIAVAEGIGREPSDSTILLSACELLILHARLCRRIDLQHRGPQCMRYEHIQTWQDRCLEIHSEILAGTRKLRERFTNGKPPNLFRLALFYPRGHEEEQNLRPILATLLHHRSTTAAAVFVRVRNWLAIQYIDEASQWPKDRKFGLDKWRDHEGSLSKGDRVNTGEVGDVLARRVLALSPAEVSRFYAPILQPSRICHLRDKAGEFLKYLCIMLDLRGDAAAFWAAWDEFAKAAAQVGSQLTKEEYWLRVKVPSASANETFMALLSAVFLNAMNFRQGQHWPPLDGQEDRFIRAFQAFHLFALDEYISFLGTIGGSLLPSAWLGVSKCVRTLMQSTGKPFFSRASYARLLRLLAQEASLNRVPVEDRNTWQAILYLLDVLADAGFAEAFRLRESLARFGT